MYMLVVLGTVGSLLSGGIVIPGEMSLSACNSAITSYANQQNQRTENTAGSALYTKKITSNGTTYAMCAKVQ